MDNDYFKQFKGLHISPPTFDYSILNSSIEEHQKELQEQLAAIPSGEDILAEQLKPIIDGNQMVIDSLKENYNKLAELYELKDKELADAKKEAKSSKRFNIVMLIVAIASMLIAAAAWLLPDLLRGGLIK
ncbi:MAG: hypothetical protein PHV32_02890 [Eubacteriales bacterium]|nr:hypothetical protein [Eubacteriales bacterium]